MKIVPRAKLVDGRVQAPRIVILNAANLERYYSLPLSLAAKDLGVCPTSLNWYCTGKANFASQFSFRNFCFQYIQK